MFSGRKKNSRGYGENSDTLNLDEIISAVRDINIAASNLSPVKTRSKKSPTSVAERPVVSPEKPLPTLKFSESDPLQVPAGGRHMRDQNPCASPVKTKMGLFSSARITLNKTPKNSLSKQKQQNSVGPYSSIGPGY